MRFVFDFDHPHDRPPRHLADLLGGKGANLAEMTSVLGLPVPPGFTVSADACRAYRSEGWPEGLTAELDEHVAALEAARGQRLGSADDPLLLSVRSGAKLSMPGMMDTVLDLGLNRETIEGLAARTGDRRFALDSYRRFIQMYGKIVLGFDGDALDAVFDDAVRGTGAAHDADLPAEVLAEVVDGLLDVVESTTGQPFPQDPTVQLRGAVEAVFRSWDSARAQAYRRREHIDDSLGTAVNVQAMVFGNRDERSGTGVAFTRDPSTGEAVPYGDFLLNAQGEDVVSGVRVTEPLEAMGRYLPEAHRELLDVLARLETHYRDMLDVEFTVEQGKLWMLQTRRGKRTGTAALRIAVAMTDEPDIALTREEALQRVTPEHLDQVLHPQFDDAERPVIATGLAASPGAAVGRVYFTADDAVEAYDRGEDVILVRVETSPDDVRGMEVAEGILTSRGGLVSHAAVVARGWGKPAVCGAEAIHVGDRSFAVGDTVVNEGEVISIDGSTGDVVLGAAHVAAADPPPEYERIMAWADEVRGTAMQVRANADTAEDARRARELGAEGIGLARTEHMFLGDRLPLVQRMILARTPEEESAALAELLDQQRRDFVEILEAMEGLPVSIRLLDPPLHEFLPSVEEMVVEEARGHLDRHSRELFEAARSWQEHNPMLGTRGVRLGVVKAGLYTMQARAIAEAVDLRRRAGGEPHVEVIIPLVVTQAELALVRRWVRAEIEEVLGSGGAQTIAVGTMVETPRAAIRADDLATEAEFFSLGTNDLTQMTFGFSRDDVEGRIMTRYLDEGLLSRNPFETVDHRGVGELVRMAVERGRSVRPDLPIGVCGEHGGDPESITFFHEVGIDYVSCSPFRVPVARLAVAQAILAQASAADGDGADGDGAEAAVNRS